MKNILYFVLLTWLTACSVAYAPQDRPTLAEQQVLLFRLDKLDAAENVVQTSLLTVQGQANGITRWVQTDVFGAPQARLLATAQGWQRDGFIPPSSLHSLPCPNKNGASRRLNLNNTKVYFS